MPHYYGPYSRKVAETLESLVGLGFVREEIEIFSEGVGYKYSLTDDGKSLVTKLREKIPLDKLAELENIVNACKDVHLLLLSLAAKVHFILKENKVPMTLTQVCEYAKGLNWQITDDQINIACRLLEQLGLIEKK